MDNQKGLKGIQYYNDVIFLPRFVMDIPIHVYVYYTLMMVPCVLDTNTIYWFEITVIKSPTKKYHRDKVCTYERGTLKNKHLCFGNNDLNGNLFFFFLYINN